MPGKRKDGNQKDSLDLRKRTTAKESTDLDPNARGRTTGKE